MTEQSSPETKRNVEAPEPSAPGLLAFLVRILEQLSLSAWFPGALLSSSLALLWTFRTQDEGVDLPAALVSLTGEPIAALLLTIPILLLATVITQAFSYSAIRFLEGYWHRRGILAMARKARIKYHTKKMDRITERKKLATTEAFMSARPKMIEKRVSCKVLFTWEAEVTGWPTGDIGVLDAQDRWHVKHGWRRFVEPWKLAVIDGLLAEDERYPRRNRILPTRLGNVLRATEDGLSIDKNRESIRDYVANRREYLPLNLRVQHDQFRTRLDMYAIMVFVNAALVLVTPVLLLRSTGEWFAVALIMAVFTILSVASYRAAISSAEGYCAVLSQIDRLRLNGTV